ncbi:hypothetical protein ACIF6L_26590 [Kitasatospora sp. NPDC086009]|uniref:hypothetical protein n=1 Tax=unclassified Kitasatospora TaxID=2633591 RepID=UPI0037CCA6DF
MPGTDAFQQNIPYPVLGDAPNAEAGLSTLVNGIVGQTVMRFASATARSAALPTPVAGMTVWLAAEARLEIYDGAAWRTYTPAGAWTTYTPTWTADSVNPTLGVGGILTSRYVKDGRRVTWIGYLRCGPLTNGGSGFWYMSLPVPAATLTMPVRGPASYVRPGSNEYLGTCVLSAGGTKVGFVTQQLMSAYTTNVGDSTPVATADTNELSWSISYESAS